MTGLAYAMGQGGSSAGQGAAAGFGAFVPLILMFVIFYFLLIRPQQKKAKEHRDMISNLKKGDRIVTSGGIHGRIVSIDDGVLKVEIADKVQIKLESGYVGALLSKGQAAKSDKSDPEEKKEERK